MSSELLHQLDIQTVTMQMVGLSAVAMAFGRRVKEEVRQRQSNRCDCCGEEVCMLQIHHRIPRALQGSNQIENAVGVCGERDANQCHQELDREAFAGQVYPQVHTKEKYYPQGNGLAE